MPLLEDGSTENEWSFGQMFAVITSVGFVVDCCNGVRGESRYCGGRVAVNAANDVGSIEYYRTKRENQRRRR